jgi:hypothetical protein
VRLWCAVGEFVGGRKDASSPEGLKLNPSKHKQPDQLPHPSFPSADGTDGCHPLGRAMSRQAIQMDECGRPLPKGCSIPQTVIIYSGRIFEYLESMRSVLNTVTVLGLHPSKGVEESPPGFT